MDDQTTTSEAPQPRPKEDASATQHQEKVIQPSASFVKEVQTGTSAKPASPIAKPQAEQSTQSLADSIYPEPQTISTPQGPETVASGIVTAPAQKVRERVPALRLFSVVIFILGILSTLSVFTSHSMTPTLASSIVSVVRDISAILPLLAAMVFFTAKSEVLVKNLLIALMVNYALGIISLGLLVFEFHSSLVAIGAVVSLLIQLGFIAWTRSVLSGVSAVSWYKDRRLKKTAAMVIPAASGAFIFYPSAGLSISGFAILHIWDLSI